MSFMQGFFLGQLTVVLLIGAFIKFFIFGEATPPPSSSRPTGRSHHKRTRTPSLHSLASSKSSPPQSVRDKSATNVLRPVPTNATDTASILRKTYYQIPHRSSGKNSHTTHQPESLDWFNVLIAQTISQYRTTAYNLRDGTPGSPPSVLTSLEAALNHPDKKPSFLDHITITEISMGEEFPIFSNVRVVQADGDDNNSTTAAAAAATGGRLQALVDVDLSDDNLTLAIETSLILNYPKPFSAVLPVALSVSVVRFSGTLSISFVPATEDQVDPTAPPTGKPKTNLAFSFLPDYRLDLGVRSLIGSRSRLQDVPKIAQLVEARAQAWFEERVVEPRVQVVPLPGMWPRMGKVRVREGQDEDRPQSQGGRSNQSSERRRSSHFPSQEEAERLFEGLRWRSGQQQRQRSVSPAVFGDEDVMQMPGALPT